jgi:NADH-quinone oxidoreductase subunit M
MLLASLLLKLGGYGFLRFSFTFLSNASLTFAPFVCALALAGVIYGSLSTIRQIDLKRIIAYSSVAHMNLVVLGLFSFKHEGIDGATYLMVAHGFVSAALFFCVGVFYERTHTRLLRYYGGLVSVMPLTVSAFFIFSLANMGFPGTANFLGELLVLQGIFSLSPYTTFFAAYGIVLSACYGTLAFNRVSFGTLKTKYIPVVIDMTRRESIIASLLAVPTIYFCVSANSILVFTQGPVAEIVQTIEQAANLLTL